MAISKDLQFAKLDELFLDPRNPRLGRNNVGCDVEQSRVLELMRDWTLEELAVSFLEAGAFWTHEALLVVKEKLYGESRLVVVEGNRRLAALKYLKDAIDGKSVPGKWAEIAESAKPPESLFNEIPYVQIDSRTDIIAFLGFRHVTGIKEWKPAEKAEYIAKLIDEDKLTYKEVMRKIGSRTDSVQRNYISYCLLKQIDEHVEEVPAERLEERFSVMYLSLRTQGVQSYLHINILADEKSQEKCVPPEHINSLKNFAIWLFGSENKKPLFTDSRRTDDFGKILAKKEAVEYLERSEEPSFDVAFRIAGGDETETINHVQKAADNIQLALTRAHAYKESEKLQSTVKGFGKDAIQLLGLFPEIYNQIIKDSSE